MYINIYKNNNSPNIIMNGKQILYYQAKALAQTLNKQPPRYIGSSLVSLQQFINDNTRPALPFLNEIRSFRRLPADIIQFRFSNQTVEEIKEQIIGLIQDGNYYVNILDENNSPINLRRGETLNRYSRDNVF